MKKLLCLILSALLAAVLTVPVLADVLWEPTDDFYWKHQDECVLVEAQYEAQAGTDLRKDPRSSASVGSVAPGDVLYVSYTWQNWGLVDDRGGWADLTGFRRLYTPEDFASQHAEELLPEEGSLSWEEHPVVRLWTFPGSGVVAQTLTAQDFSWAEDGPGYYQVWTGSDGGRWGRVGYYYGSRGWIFLDDPAAEDLPADAPRYASDQDPQWEPDPVPARSADLILTLIAAVVALTAVLLIVIVLRGRKRRPAGE